MKNLEKLYFPNLNGLRCIAALLVIIHHVDFIKSFYLKNYWCNFPFVRSVGHLGVILFFVLSGFLITYLLLKEEKTTKKISVKHFYIRRILRIWPLYFLIIILALFVLPNFSFFTIPGFGKDVSEDLPLKLVLYFTFFSNLVFSFWSVPYASQTWSIGTEEQFYLVWPIIMKYIKKNRIFLMISVIILYTVISLLLNSQYLKLSPISNIFAKYWNAFNIDCMAIGGIFAVLSFQGSKSLKIFLNKYLFYIILVSTFVLLFKGYCFPMYNDKIFAFLFGIIILNFATNKEIKISLENKIFNYLGKISYGLYMYHPIAIVIAIKAGIYTGYTSNYILLAASIILTIIISGLSYKYFEKIFLAYKARFSSIISGDSYKD